MHSMTLWPTISNSCGRGSVWLATASLLISGAAFGQESADDIRHALKTRQDGDLVLALGKQGNHADIPLLQDVAREALNSKNDSLYRSTSLALARLGDEVAFLNTASEVYTNDGQRLNDGFDRLTYIGDSRTLRVLLDRLDDAVSPQQKSDMMFWSPRSLSLVTLSKIIPNPPVKVDYRFLTFRMKEITSAVGLWQAYFRGHPDLLVDHPRSNWPETLRQLVSRADVPAILVLGRIADDSIIPSLRRYAAADGLSAGVAGAIQLVLARFGDSPSYQEILKDVHGTDPSVQNSAIEKVIYIGGERGVRTLAALLDAARRKNILVGLSHLIPGFPLEASVDEQEQRIEQWLKERRL
jgi:hypothetical protein